MSMGIFAKTNQCRICASVHRAEVDAMLAAGAGLREVAVRFGFSTAGVGRHSLRHAPDDDANAADAGLKRLIDATERLLTRSERKGDSSGVMAALKLLAELRKRGRIESASARPQANSVNADDNKPQPEERDATWLVSRMKQIYGIGDRKHRAVLYEHKFTNDERCVEQLGGLVKRRADSDPTTAALATRLASRILQVPLDEQTEAQVARLEVTEEADAQEMVGEADGNEGIDTGPSDRGDERHVDNPDVDDHD
jgi:hypothetical protein